MDLPTNKEQTTRRQPLPNMARCGRQKWFIRDSFINLQKESTWPRLKFSEVNESEEDVDTTDNNPENVDAEVAEYDSSTDEEEEVEGGGSHILA